MVRKKDIPLFVDEKLRSLKMAPNIHYSWSDCRDKLYLNYAKRSDPEEFIECETEILYKEKGNAEVKRRRDKIYFTRKDIINFSLFCDNRLDCDKCPLYDVCWKGFGDYLDVGIFDEI